MKIEEIEELDEPKILIPKMPKCEMTSTGLEIDDDVTYEEWLEIGRILGMVSRAFMSEQDRERMRKRKQKQLAKSIEKTERKN